MKLSEYILSIKDKKITVLGAGVSNTPLIKKLVEYGCNVTVCDKSEREQLGTIVDEFEQLGAKFNLGAAYLDNIDADIIFRTPGMHPHLPQLKTAVEKGSVLTSEMEVFFNICPCRIIAVTGSDGKTTTTSIIAELLKAAGYTVHVGGNIGTPLLCQADEMDREDIVVLELSSFQLMTMSASPDIAVVTNISPNHLDVHKDYQEYIDAKKNILLYQNAESSLILNSDNEVAAGFSADAKGNVKYFSRIHPVQDGMYCIDGTIYRAKNGISSEIMNVSEIFLPGEHNIENYMAAFTATEGLVSDKICVDVAKSFKGVEHRIEFVRELNGIKFYNDSIASSPSRTIAGLHSFKQKVILIAGGKDKGVPFDSLGPEILNHAKALVVTGLTAEKIKTAVINADNYYDTFQIVEEGDFKDAVLAAYNLAEDGDIVILSPACTSFDRFKNFAQRGQIFKEIVNNLE